MEEILFCQSPSENPGYAFGGRSPSRNSESRFLERKTYFLAKILNFSRLLAPQVDIFIQFQSVILE